MWPGGCSPVSSLPGEDAAIKNYVAFRLTGGLSIVSPGAWMALALTTAGGPYLRPGDAEILALVARAELLVTAQKMARRLSGED